MTVDEAFHVIHQGLSRQGPGSEATTKALFAAIGHPENIKRAIDMGCGPGSSAVWLAKQKIEVVAIDTHEPFLDELRAAAVQAGVADRLELKNMSIDDVEYPDTSFDLVWSEGTAYFIGWSRALTSWKRLLKPGGYLIVTDLFWVTDTPSPELVSFFADDNVLHLENAEQIVRDSGLSIVKTYIQPDSDWFDEYYNPLAERVKSMSKDPDESMQKSLERMKQEILLRQKYKGQYEHVGFVFRLPPEASL